MGLAGVDVVVLAGRVVGAGCRIESKRNLLLVEVVGG